MWSNKLLVLALCISSAGAFSDDSVQEDEATMIQLKVEEGAADNDKDLEEALEEDASSAKGEKLEKKWAAARKSKPAAPAPIKVSDIKDYEAEATAVDNQKWKKNERYEKGMRAKVQALKEVADMKKAKEALEDQQFAMEDAADMMAEAENAGGASASQPVPIWHPTVHSKDDNPGANTFIDALAKATRKGEDKAVGRVATEEEEAKEKEDPNTLSFVAKTMTPGLFSIKLVNAAALGLFPFGGACGQIWKGACSVSGSQSIPSLAEVSLIVRPGFALQKEMDEGRCLVKAVSKGVAGPSGYSVALSSPAGSGRALYRATKDLESDYHINMAAFFPTGAPVGNSFAFGVDCGTVLGTHFFTGESLDVGASSTTFAAVADRGQFLQVASINVLGAHRTQSTYFDPSGAFVISVERSKEHCQLRDPKKGQEALPLAAQDKVYIKDVVADENTCEVHLGVCDLSENKQNELPLMFSLAGCVDNHGKLPFSVGGSKPAGLFTVVLPQADGTEFHSSTAFYMEGAPSVRYKNHVVVNTAIEEGIKAVLYSGRNAALSEKKLHLYRRVTGGAGIGDRVTGIAGTPFAQGLTVTDGGDGFSAFANIAKSLLRVAGEYTLRLAKDGDETDAGVLQGLLEVKDAASFELRTRWIVEGTTVQTDELEITKTPSKLIVIKSASDTGKQCDIHAIHTESRKTIAKMRLAKDDQVTVLLRDLFKQGQKWSGPEKKGERSTQYHFEVECLPEHGRGVIVIKGDQPEVCRGDQCLPCKDGTVKAGQKVVCADAEKSCKIVKMFRCIPEATDGLVKKLNEQYENGKQLPARIVHLLETVIIEHIPEAPANAARSHAQQQDAMEELEDEVDEPGYIEAVSHDARL